MEAAPYSIYPLGDRALTIELGKAINEPTHEQVIQLYHQLLQNPIPFVTDIIPAYCSISLVYEPVLIHKAHPHLTAFQQISNQLIVRMEQPGKKQFSNRLVQIPVCYTPLLGPDLGEVAGHAGIDVNELIRLHTERTYKVYMIGFLPGFPYMASVNEKLRMPRKASPRQHVPAGSVGIAGEQTGIYPLESPGGWQLIGQTPLLLFDVSEENPCLLQPGDEVIFNPISLAEFHAIKNQLRP
jgi:inhibitor of KinA